MSGFRVFLVVLAACIAVAAVGGYALWRAFGPSVSRELQRVNEEAAGYGRAHDQSACVDEAFRRLRACDGILCEVQLPTFTKACLASAPVSGALCADVPETFIEAVLWPQIACAKLDARPQICDRILREVVKTCFKSRTG